LFIGIKVHPFLSCGCHDLFDTLKNYKYVGISGSEDGIYTMTREDIEIEMKLICLYDFFRKEYE
jgi:hypothetical protein